MKVDIEKIGPDGLDVIETIDEGWLGEALGDRSEFRPSAPGSLSLHLDRINDVVHARGRARLALRAQCSRCLGPVNLRLDTPLGLTVVPQQATQAPGHEGELSDADVGVSTYSNQQLDLLQLVRDEVFLELPMRALCNPDCNGLCPSCGRDRNEGSCTCEPPVDHRWSALQHIKLS